MKFGPQELQEYLVNEVQSLTSCRVEINDKHVEVIVRQTLRKVRITEPGDTEFLWGEQIEKTAFAEVNQKAMEEETSCGSNACSVGYHKASLETDSYFSKIIPGNNSNLD